MFYIAGISIAVFISFLLLSKKNKSGADGILIVFMLTLLVHLSLFYLLETEEIYNYPFLLGIEHPFPILHGIFLYLYVAAVTNQLPQRRGFISLNFVPILIIYLYLGYSFFPLSGAEKIAIYQNEGAGFETFIFLLSIFINGSGVFYVIWSNWLLRKHQRNILDKYSDIEKVNLEWLQFLTWGLGAIWLFVIFIPNAALTFYAAVIFIFLIGFFGVRQGDIFMPLKENKTIVRHEGSQKTIAPKSPKKYAKSGLTKTAAENIHTELMQLMNKEEIYKDSSLTISDLAKQLNTHPNYLSQIINEQEGGNFYEFINGYRVNEFKRLVALPKNKNFTLLSLAHECGFNSKSTFNKYFKKKTGQTPSAYFAALRAIEE